MQKVLSNSVIEYPQLEPIFRPAPRPNVFQPCFKMAAFNRPTEATYEVHENISVDTQDNEDHTFCGIMFPVKCKDLLPLDHILIKSVAVRGQLGPLTIWVSKREEHERRGTSSNQQRIRLDPRYWTKLYNKTHGPSRREYEELKLDEPIHLVPGETRVLYIHSTLPGDEAIVYDNSQYGQASKRYEDDKISIMSGRAHVSNDVFGQEPIWGWGNAWRDRREFVGRLNYGTVYKLWNPQVQPKFGGNFQDGARALLLCQRRWESPMSMLPDECLYYILNMCRWDWFHDDAESMRKRRKREKAKLLEQEKTGSKAPVSMQQSTEMDQDDQKMSASCNRKCKTDRAPAAVKKSGEDEIHDQKVSAREDDVEMEEEEEEGDDDDDAAFEAFGSDDDEEIDEDDSDGDDEEDWSDDEDQYHRANVDAFTFHDVDSDDEERDLDADAAQNSRREWMRRQFARIHVLRALANMEDNEVGQLQF